MARMLADELLSRGIPARAYLEFDFTNPIDFYCTAYLSSREYDQLCAERSSELETIKANTIHAGSAELVRYYDEDTPLFSEPLLSELAAREFCYNPPRPVPLEAYTAAYAEVWRNFAREPGGGFLIFDGSLLHHPINDMLRNYSVAKEQALSHVSVLLGSLGEIRRKIFYLRTDDPGAQLVRAHTDRGESSPTGDSIRFWQKRGEYDHFVLENISEYRRIFNVTDGGWDCARGEILRDIMTSSPPG